MLIAGLTLGTALVVVVLMGIGLTVMFQDKIFVKRAGSSTLDSRDSNVPGPVGDPLGEVKAINARITARDAAYQSSKASLAARQDAEFATYQAADAADKALLATIHEATGAPKATGVTS